MIFTLITVAVITVLAILYYYLSIPINRIVRLGDLGFYFGEPRISGLYRERQLERLKRLRLVGEIPPVYPNGWFCIAESSELIKGQIKPIIVFGEQLSLIRSDTETVHLIDSYCPHLGANFNVGGKVVDNNCVQCPFHGWVFSAETGKCTRIPYDKGTIPEQAKVSVWPIVERNQHIYVWYHCDGHDPSWEIPEIEEISSGEWTAKGRTEHEVMCHCQEIPENGADLAHLNYLHLQIPIVGNNVIDLSLHNSNPKLRHIWNGAWAEQKGENSHISIMNLDQTMTLFGREIPMVNSHLDAHQIGPGIVYMHFKFGRLGSAVVMHHVTPEEPLMQKVRFKMFSNIGQVLCNIFMLCESLQFERDVYVWSNKMYIRSPLLCRNDGPIQKHRRWYSQFYSENSPRLLADGSLSNRAKSIHDW